MLVRLRQTHLTFHDKLLQHMHASYSVAHSKLHVRREECYCPLGVPFDVFGKRTNVLLHLRAAVALKFIANVRQVLDAAV